MSFFGLTPYQRGMDMFEDFEKRFFGGMPGYPNGGAFRTDIVDRGDHYLLQSELPGFDKQDISIDVQGDYLTISAVHEQEYDENGQDNAYIRRERTYGEYRRSFDVGNIDKEGIQAAYTNGVLELRLPKAANTAPQARRIEIQ
jgi:HSP20 family protein